MQKLCTLTVTALVFLATWLPAQESQTSQPPPRSRNAVPWEIGMHTGHLFSSGNVDFIPGFGTGIHVRRSLDYVFSWRFELLYGSLRGEDKGSLRHFETEWFSGSLQAIASLNARGRRLTAQPLCEQHRPVAPPAERHRGPADGLGVARVPGGSIRVWRGTR